jgi:predicted DNA-binding transcriptional regulator AlpA
LGHPADQANAQTSLFREETLITPTQSATVAREVSELTGLAVSTLYHFVSQKRISVVRLPKRCLRFRLSSLERWFEELTEETCRQLHSTSNEQNNEPVNLPDGFPLMTGGSTLREWCAALLQFYYSGPFSAGTLPRAERSKAKRRSFKTQRLNGAGRGIFLNPFPAANGISKMQCFA